MNKKIELFDIVMEQNFLREIHRAANLSYNYNKESGFIVYIDESLSRPHVNQAILGNDRSIASDITQEFEHHHGTGAHIPAYNYRLVDVHFHPPKSHLHPSGGDINDHLAARIVNLNLIDASTEFQTEIYEDEERTRLKGYQTDFPKLVSIIGLVRDKPEDIELLVYQGISEEPITFDTFSEFVVNYCERVYGYTYDPITFRKLGFPTRFRSTKKIVEFLNESKYLQSDSINIKNGKLSDKDLEKLKKFQLIQTRFFPEEPEYSEDDYLDKF